MLWKEDVRREVGMLFRSTRFCSDTDFVDVHAILAQALPVDGKRLSSAWGNCIRLTPIRSSAFAEKEHNCACEYKCGGRKACRPSQPLLSHF